jgi:hypothetical protein
MGHTFGQDNKAFLQAPAEQNLCRRFVVLGHKWLEQRIVTASGANKRRVGFQYDTALVAPLNDIRTREPRVELHLIDAEDTSVVGRLFLGNVSVVHRRAATHLPSATAPVRRDGELQSC